MIAAYKQTVDRHRQRIFSFAHYSLRVREDAEDITQEVFIKLWHNWNRVDHEKVGAWLMRVAHNAVVDHVRKNRHADQKRDEFKEPDQTASEVDEVAKLDQEYFNQHLQLAIKALNDPFRSILVMRDIQGMSYAEIEQSLDMSESQVKVYLHRGRRKLRENPRLREIFATMNQSQSGQARAMKETQ